MNKFMQFEVVECEQRSPEWYAAHAGLLTSSMAGDMLTNPRKGSTVSVTRQNLCIRLACETLTGISQMDGGDGFASRAMQRGIDLESKAFGELEIITGKVVHKVGFIRAIGLPVGDSPDGIVGDFEEVVEFKCPNSLTHYQYMRAGLIPADYIDQCRHHVWVTGAEWCNFISFDDRFPPELQLFHVRAHRDTLFIPEYDQAARKFLTEFQQEADAMRALVAKRKAA